MMKRFVVVREYSWTDRRCLWKVLSRGFKEEREAIDWMDFMISEDSKKRRHKMRTYRVVQVLVEKELTRS